MNLRSSLIVKSLNLLPFNIIERISENTAINCFNRSLIVGGYSVFLNKHNFRLSKLKQISDFKHVPITDKGNYIIHNPLQKLSLNSDNLSFYRSSGYSGDPTYWSQNTADYNKFTNYERDNLDIGFDILSKKTLIISMFALSSWVTGQQVLASLFDIAKKNTNVSIFACGMVIDEPLDMIKRFGNDFDQVIIFTYPLTFKAFADKAQEIGINLSTYNIKILLGAEGVTYEWANYFNELLNGNNGKEYRVFSAYGSADSGVGIAAEHVSGLLIKEHCFNDRNLLFNLTGKDEMPLHFFQYNPLVDYLEIVDNNLLITKYKQVPLIRYNLHDKALILKPCEVINKFQEVGIDLKSEVNKYGAPLLNLPYLVIYGREDGTVILNGANIYLNSINEALSQKEIINLHTGKFKIKVFNDKDLFQNYKIQIELRKGIKESTEIRELIKGKIISFLLEHDKGYAAAYHIPYKRDDICKIEFVKFPNSLKHKFKDE